MKERKLIEKHLKLSFEYTLAIFWHTLRWTKKSPKERRLFYCRITTKDYGALTCGFLSSSGKMDTRWYTADQKVESRSALSLRRNQD